MRSIEDVPLKISSVQPLDSGIFFLIIKAYLFKSFEEFFCGWALRGIFCMSFEATDKLVPSVWISSHDFWHNLSHSQLSGLHLYFLLNLILWQIKRWMWQGYIIWPHSVFSHLKLWFRHVIISSSHFPPSFIIFKQLSYYLFIFISGDLVGRFWELANGWCLNWEN